MISSFLTDVIVVAIVLSVMIFVHELGHFLAAKSFGVRVLIFSLGIGKRLFGLKRGDTDYRISALPLGGFVKMAGDDPSQDRSGDPGEFLSKPRWQRFVVIAMGPAMNIVMAVFLLTGLYRFHFSKPAYQEQPARVGDLDPASPAATAGLTPGDLIVGFDGVANPRWEDIDLKILTTVDEAIPLRVERSGRILDLQLTPRSEGPDRTGYAGWYPYLPAIIDQVEPGMPAAKAGLKPGDQIVAMDGQKILCGPRLALAFQAGGGKVVNLTVRRAGRDFEIQVQPVFAEAVGEKRWRIGVGFHNDFVVRSLPWNQAFSASLHENTQLSLVTFDLLRKILTKRVSPKQLSGPIGIAQASGQAYRSGLPDLLHLVCMISLQLAIFNLLPIPILDGGQISLLLIEAVIRRDLSLRVKERVVQVGMVFLLLLVGFVMFNDIVKTIKPY